MIHHCCNPPKARVVNTLEQTMGFSPCPYTERVQHDQSSEEQVPQYVAPAYNQSSSTSKTLQDAMTKFPPTMNGYFQWKMTSTFHLSPTAEQFLKIVRSANPCFRLWGQAIIDGPTKEDPVLATLKSDKWGRTRPVDTTLPPRLQAHHMHAIDMQMIPASSNRVSPTHTFEIQWAEKRAGRDRFEWRKTPRNVINELAIGHSYSGSWCGCPGQSTAPAGAERMRIRKCQRWDGDRGTSRS